jgi:hypothetical protein
MEKKLCGRDAKEQLPVIDASQNSRPQTRNKSNLYFPAACTSGNTLLGLQTCEPSVADGGAVRCSRPHPHNEVT